MEKEKKKFEKPIAEVVDFSNDDIITDSAEGFLIDGQTEEW